MAQPDLELQRSMLWPDRKRGPYRLRITLGQVGGRLEVVGVEMWGVQPPDPQTPPGDDHWRSTWWQAAEDEVPISSTAIRLPLDRLARDMIERSRRTAEIITRAPALARFRPGAERRLAMFDAQQGPNVGRRPLGDDHYRQVAEAYSAACEDGLPPTTTVAEQSRVSKTTAAKWVARARDLGYLPPTTRGKAAPQEIDKRRDQ